MKPKDAEALNRALATAQGILTPEQRRPKRVGLPVPPPRQPVNWGRVALILFKAVGWFVAAVVLWHVSENAWFGPVLVVGYVVCCIFTFAERNARDRETRMREFIRKELRNR